MRDRKIEGVISDAFTISVNKGNVIDYCKMVDIVKANLPTKPAA